MDNPLGQTVRKPGPPSSTSTPRKRVRADRSATPARILEAARRRLCDAGYARLNVRDIARDAGVNHALISYHFQGKQQLVLAVLDEANKALLERQTRMYEEPSSASTKWQQACAFYEEDLKSGFVRLMMELMGASFNDKELRDGFVPRLLVWMRLVESGVDNFIQSSGLELPISSRAIAAWISWGWLGMEASMTLGISEAKGHQREALEAVALLLRRIEAPQSAPRRAKARRST